MEKDKPAVDILLDAIKAEWRERKKPICDDEKELEAHRVEMEQKYGERAIRIVADGY